MVAGCAVPGVKALRCIYLGLNVNACKSVGIYESVRNLDGRRLWHYQRPCAPPRPAWQQPIVVLVCTRR